MSNSPFPLPTPTQYRNVVDGLLNRGYDAASADVMRAIAVTANSGEVGKRLREMDEAAKSLKDATANLKPGDPLLRSIQREYEQAVNRLLNAFEDSLTQQAKAIDAASGAVQASGINVAGQATQYGAFGGLDPTVIGVDWNTPDPEAVAQLVGYTNSDEWQALIDSYSADISEVARGIAVRGIVEGASPLATARELRNAVEGLPAYTANNMMRTLQLTSYRDASLANRIANRDILDYQIRIASLDDRCCLACISLNGEKLPIDARIEDHHQGRCDSIPVVKGFPRNVPSGEDWFNSRTEAEQRAQMGNANYEAWKAGKVNLRDFAQKYTDPVFKEMVREASLKSLIGNEAQKYYSMAAPTSSTSSRAAETRAAAERDARRIAEGKAFKEKVRRGEIKIDTNRPAQPGDVPIPPRNSGQ